MTIPRTIAGRYRLDGVIGRGSMGTVFEAYDDVLRRAVAIKEVTFPAGMAAAETTEIAHRTLREARAIAALSHPHVITLFDILTPDTGPVIVMELMTARSLAEIVREAGRLGDVDAAVIGAAVASGLMAAHAAGITHRDVKPANVLIGDDGRIKLTDFGIARSAAEQTMTATGMLLGSPAYISPEVASGRPATPSADAWGLGALLFAVVEGHPPFDRGRPLDTMSAVVSDPVPEHPHSGRLGTVIDGLLVKDPARRMAVAEAFDRLSAIAAGRTFLPPHPAETRGGDLAHGADMTPLPPALDLPSNPPLPPPPWSAEAGASLAPLPPTADPPRRGRLLAAAIAVGVIAAALGLGWVLFFAHLA